MSMAKQTYTVTSPIEHDGVRYAEGKPIDLTDERAAPLLAVGAIKPKQPKSDGAKTSVDE